MSVAAVVDSSPGLSGREIRTLDSLYEAAGGVNLTPASGKVARQSFTVCQAQGMRLMPWMNALWR